MQSIRDDMTGGLAAFVEGQRKEPGTCTLSLYQFDDQYEVMFEAIPLRRVPKIALEPLGRPRCSTA